VVIDLLVGRLPVCSPPMHWKLRGQKTSLLCARTEHGAMLIERGQDVNG
jgi:hypothetical protein